MVDGVTEGEARSEAWCKSGFFVDVMEVLPLPGPVGRSAQTFWGSAELSPEPSQVPTVRMASPRIVPRPNRIALNRRCRAASRERMDRAGQGAEDVGTE